MKTVWIAGAVALGLAAHAEAGPLAEALTRHGASDVTALRAKRSDPVAACTLGAVYAKRNDLPRAMLFLATCDGVTLPEDIASEIPRIVRETKKKARESELAELQIVSTPAGLTAELDALAGEKLTTPASAWVKAGTHTVRVTGTGIALQNTVTVQAYSRSIVFLDAGERKATAPKSGTVDFSQDNATESTSGPPPDIRRPSLMKDKYRGVAGPRSGPELEDPLAVRIARGPKPWFGLRLGGGVFDDGATPASWRPSVAGAARFRLANTLFLAARIDWSRRGGIGGDAIDAFGASLGAGLTLAARRALAVALLGQLRGDLRFADARDMTPVRRAGASVAGGLELAFPTTPFTAGLRFEQGLTELVAGARDRAVLVELGVDWR